MSSVLRTGERERGFLISGRTQLPPGSSPQPSPEGQVPAGARGGRGSLLQGG